MQFHSFKYSTMRRLVHLSLFILCLPLASLATDYYWNGPTTGSQNFNDPANWLVGGSTPATAPGSGDVAIFQATSGVPIGALSFSSAISVGAIVVDSISGGVSPDVTFTGTLSLAGATVGPIANPTGTIGAYTAPTGLVANYGKITVSSNLSVNYDLHTRNTGNIDLTGTTTFTGEASLDADGSNGIYFNNVIVDSDPTGLASTNVNLIGRTTASYVINGNLTMTSGGIRNSGSSVITAELKLAGNLTSTAVFTDSDASLRFIGSANQTVTLFSGSEARWSGNIIFDVNPNPVDGSNNPLPPANIILNSPLVIDNPTQSVIFNYGIVESDVNNALIFNNANATTTGANNNSYVHGYVRRKGTSQFVFPIGDGGFYAPVSLGGTTGNFGSTIPQVNGVDPTYQATYVRQNPLTSYPNNAPQPTDGQTPTPTTLTISKAEYFLIDYVGNSADLTPANTPFAWFSYQSTRSGGISSGGDAYLYIVDWTGSNWELNGSTGTGWTDNAITYLQSGQIFTTGNAVPVFTLATNNPTLNPLPVKWLTFTGTATKGVVELNWSTASELDNREFTIQRSADGNNFQSIGTVEGQGTTTAVSSYTFTDQQPLKGIAYYRIKQTDINGKFSYSSVIRISSNSQNGGALRLYPNPAVTSAPLKVEYSNFRNQLVTVSIINAAGIVVHKELVNFGTDSRATLNISRLQRGSYFVSMVSGTQRQTIPFVIQ